MNPLTFKRVFVTGAGALVTLWTGAGLAQPYALGLEAPRQLAAAEATASSSAVFYLRAPSYFGASRTAADQARIRLKPQDAGRGIFVDLGSPAINAAIREQFRSRGIAAVDEPAAASYYLTGSLTYIVESKPHPPRLVRLGADYSRATSTESSIGDARRNAGEAMVNLAASTANRASDPATFLMNIIETLVDQSGLTQAVADQRAGGGRLQAEEFAIGDCYDRTTRLAAERCATSDLPGYYLLKTRLQAVELYARFGTTRDAEVPRRPQQHVRIIARRIDARSYTGIDVNELVASALSELAAEIGEASPPPSVDTPSEMPPVVEPTREEGETPRENAS